jgi:carbamoyl-phosphate synthase large subunit
MTKVLFTGGGGAGNEAIWRLLKDKYDLYFADADAKSINPIIPEEKRLWIPLASNESYISYVIGLAKGLNIDLIIPGVDEELPQLAFYSPIELLLPDAEYIETMSDKLNMIRTLKYKNILVPFTQVLSTRPIRINYPCIVKPRHGRGSRDVRIMNNQREVNGLRFGLGDEADNYIIQEKIEGVEYTVQMVANAQGTLQAIVPVRVDIKCGVTIRAETDDNPIVIEACKKIHEAVPTKGCYNIQLISTGDKVYPFEINPRISTTFCMTLAAGIDPIMIYGSFLKLADGLLPFNKIKLQRHWTNYFTEEV